MSKRFTRSYIDPRILEEFGDDYLDISGDEIRYLCPYCESVVGTEDRSGHLYVNCKRLTYFCHRCNTKGVIRRNSKGYNFEPDVSQLELQQMLESIVFAPSKMQFNLELPELKPLPGSEAYNYLIRRGITPEMIDFYDIRQGSILSKYKHRVIIPNQVIHLPDGRSLTDMFVARYIRPTKNEQGVEVARRYLNPSGQSRNQVVFNLHRIPERSPIILTEGCFTSIIAGFNAVCTYGKYVNDDQVRQILQKSPSRIYVNLDGDAYDDARKLCDVFRRRTSAPVYLVRFKKSDGEHADAADVGHAQYTKYLAKARLYDPVELKIMDLSGINHKYLDAFE